MLNQDNNHWTAFHRRFMRALIRRISPFRIDSRCAGDMRCSIMATIIRRACTGVFEGEGQGFAGVQYTAGHYHLARRRCWKYFHVMSRPLRWHTVLSSPQSSVGNPQLSPADLLVYRFGKRMPAAAPASGASAKSQTACGAAHSSGSCTLQTFCCCCSKKARDPAGLPSNHDCFKSQ